MSEDQVLNSVLALLVQVPNRWLNLEQRSKHTLKKLEELNLKLNEPTSKAKDKKTRLKFMFLFDIQDGWERISL